MCSATCTTNIVREPYSLARPNEGTTAVDITHSSCGSWKLDLRALGRRNARFSGPAHPASEVRTLRAARASLTAIASALNRDGVKPRRVG
jgi:hypothetical protein